MKSTTFTFLLGIALSVLLGSCNPFLTKEARKKKRCNRKLERVVEKCPDLLKTDTIEVPFEVKVPELTIKDSIRVIIDSSKVDSLVNKLNALKSNETKIKYITRFIEQNFKLDTLIEDSLYSMRIQIVNGVIIPEITIKERNIKGTTITEVEKVSPIELTWYEKLLDNAWSFVPWLLIIFILLLFRERLRKLFSSKSDR